ncbi:MAG: hypothetical protein F6K24_04855 [Okeania sp. SIO2D1]|nr:hypothetical protein [Okeania sp. SIO2D1]
MDKLELYRTCIHTLLEKYGQSKFRNEDVENELFFDSIRNHYQPSDNQKEIPRGIYCRLRSIPKDGNSELCRERQYWLIQYQEFNCNDFLQFSSYGKTFLLK